MQRLEFVSPWGKLSEKCADTDIYLSRSSVAAPPSAYECVCVSVWVKVIVILMLFYFRILLSIFVFVLRCCLWGPQVKQKAQNVHVMNGSWLDIYAYTYIYIYIGICHFLWHTHTNSHRSQKQPPSRRQIVLPNNTFLPSQARQLSYVGPTETLCVCVCVCAGVC